MKSFEILRDVALILGYTVICEQDGKLNCSKDGKKTFHWNPLTDDGDCSRLEVDLGISVSQGFELVTAEIDHTDESIVVEYFKNHADKYKGTLEELEERLAEYSRVTADTIKAINMIKGA